MTYVQGEVIEGRGTQVRVSILDTGVLARPAVSAMRVLTGVTTSEIAGTQDTRDIPGDYDSSINSDWKDSRPGARGWSFSLTANKKMDTPQAQLLKDLWSAWAAGKYVWVERLTPGATEWVGGLAYITDPKEPVPWDGAITFNCGFTGKRELVRTAA